MHKIKAKKCTLPILGQLLSFIPQEFVKNSVQQFQFDKWYKQVMSWDQFVFMFYGVLTGCSTLREIIKNFMLMGEELIHCHILKVPKRSSISDANAKRNSQVFGHLYMQLYHHYKKFTCSPWHILSQYQFVYHTIHDGCY